MTVSNPLLLHCIPLENFSHSPQILLTSSQYGPCSGLSTWTVPALSDPPLLCPIHPSFSLEYFFSLPRLRTPVRLIVSITVQLYIQEVLTEHLCGPGTRYSTVSMIDTASVCIKPTLCTDHSASNRRHDQCQGGSAEHINRHPSQSQRSQKWFPEDMPSQLSDTACISNGISGAQGKGLSCILLQTHSTCRPFYELLQAGDKLLGDKRWALGS